MEETLQRYVLFSEKSVYYLHPPHRILPLPNPAVQVLQMVQAYPSQTSWTVFAQMVALPLIFIFYKNTRNTRERRSSHSAPSILHLSAVDRTGIVPFPSSFQQKHPYVTLCPIRSASYHPHCFIYTRFHSSLPLPAILLHIPILLLKR